MAALGVGAALIGVAGPAESVQAALRTINVNGVPVTVTEVGMRSVSRLSAANADTVQLRDGSRGEFWTFDAAPGQCVSMTMRSEAFHPYLSLRTGAPEGGEVIHDDGLSDTWATVSGRVSANETYYLLATSSGGGERQGQYTLAIERC